MESKTYKATPQLTFILTPDKTIVQTPLQAFYLTPSEYCWRKRMNTVRTLIMLNEIRSLNELAEWCAVGRKPDRPEPISWIATSMKNV